eukprot:g33528.t1
MRYHEDLPLPEITPEKGIMMGAVNVIKLFAQNMIYGFGSGIKYTKATLEQRHAWSSWIHYQRQVVFQTPAVLAVKKACGILKVIGDLKNPIGDSIYVGHDDDLDALAMFFDVSWEAPPWGTSSPTPPGSALTFRVTYPTVEVEFIYPTFDGSAFPQLNVVRTTPPTVDLGVVEARAVKLVQLYAGEASLHTQIFEGDWCDLPEDLVEYLVPWKAAPPGKGIRPSAELVSCLQLILRGWAPTACEAHAFRLPGELLHGVSEHFSLLAKLGHLWTQRRWVYSFQSTWRMALKLLEFLQVLALDGFDIMSDLAYWLHRRSYREAQRARRNEQEIWTAVAKEPPVFRIAGTASGPLRHDVRAAAVVDVAARARRADAQPFRMVEVGVFQGNLSKHIWQRRAFELHLVDHWGAPYVPLATRKELEESLGTGSNMAGQSNNSALQRLWHHFGAKGARRFEVPHWLGEKRACGETTRAAASSADLFVHRSASIAPARCFLDGSLDLVYIDADHKWWSVLQDLTTWWPKIKPGGVMMGHDFHFNSLMERASLDGGDINDVPLAVGAFFRWPTTVSLHSGFVWSVQKPLDSQPNATEAQLQRQDLYTRAGYELSRESAQQRM